MKAFAIGHLKINHYITCQIVSKNDFVITVPCNRTCRIRFYQCFRLAPFAVLAIVHPAGEFHVGDVGACEKITVGIA